MIIDYYDAGVVTATGQCACGGSDMCSLCLLLHERLHLPGNTHTVYCQVPVKIQVLIHHSIHACCTHTKCATGNII